MSIRCWLVGIMVFVLPCSFAEPQESPIPVVSETAATQIMLDRAGFSPGEIDGRRGRNLSNALKAFQRAYNLTPTGAIDDETWNALSDRAGDQPPLVTYVITEEDLAAPFVDRIPPDLMEQAQLESLAYTSPLEMFAEKFHASPRFLRRLNAGAAFDRVGERIVVPNVATPDPLTPAPGPMPAARIVVSRATSALTVEDAEGRLLRYAPVTTGSTRDPLPIGTWKVAGVQRMPEFYYNPALFWDADPSHAKARIAPGPNNPVGTVWIDLTKEHYGIHGTPEPSHVGHAESHGCVRLTNWDANRVAGWTKPGTEVIFQ